MAEPKVTLAHKKNLRDAESKKPALIERIKAASGVEYEFELEPKFDEFIVGLIKGGSRYHEQIGDVLYNANGYLDHAAKLFEKNCKDDMIKEALVDATANKKIILRLDPQASVNSCVQFKDGNLYLTTTAKNFNSYLSYMSDFDISKIL